MQEAPESRYRYDDAGRVSRSTWEGRLHGQDRDHHAWNWRELPRKAGVVMRGEEVSMPTGARPQKRKRDEATDGQDGGRSTGCIWRWKADFSDCRTAGRYGMAYNTSCN